MFLEFHNPLSNKRCDATLSAKAVMKLHARLYEKTIQEAKQFLGLLDSSQIFVTKSGSTELASYRCFPKLSVTGLLSTPTVLICAEAPSPMPFLHPLQLTEHMAWGAPPHKTVL